MTSYNVSVLYDTTLEIGCPNNGVQFNMQTPGVHYKFALIKLPHN